MKHLKEFLSVLVLLTFMIIAGGSFSEVDVIFYLILGFAAIIFTVVFNNSHQSKASKEKEKIWKKYEIEQQNKTKHLAELKQQFSGPIAKIINYDNSHFVLISEKESSIMINDHKYAFDDILKFTVSDNSIEVYAPTRSTTTTNTGSMLGRAIIGGVLTGGVGAVIGGATASKTTRTAQTSSETKHDYKIIVTVNRLSNPIEIMHLKRDEKTLNELCGLLTIILNRK